MDLTHLVMPDERATLLLFAGRENFSLDTRLDPYWRQGDRVAFGEPYPTIVEAGRYPTKHRLPVRGKRDRENLPDELSRMRRAVLPFAAVFAKPEDQSEIARSDLTTGDPNGCRFIAAYAHKGDKPDQYNGTSILTVPPATGRSGWITWEPLVLGAQAARQWLSGAIGPEDLRPENAHLQELVARPELR